MKRILTAILTASLICSWAAAADIQMGHIPADSKWVIHFNADSFGQTEYWQMAKNNIPEKKMDKINQLSEFLGFNVLKGLDGVTLYGPDSKQENGVLMVYGEFDKPHVISGLKENDEYSQELYRSEYVHQWRDPKDSRLKTGIFASENHIVVSENKKAVKKFIDMKADEVNSLEDNAAAPISALVGSADKNAVMVLGVVELDKLKKGRRNNAILSNSSMLAVVSGENEGITYVDFDLTTKDSESAKQVEQMVNGIKAFLMLKSKDNDDARSILEKSTITREGNQLFMTLEVPSEKIYKAMKNSKKIMNCKDE